MVSLFSDAEEKKEKIGDDSNGEESDADQKFQGQLFNYDFALESGRKKPDLPLMIKIDRRRLQ